jgi:hypothetical protein
MCNLVRYDMASQSLKSAYVCLHWASAEHNNVKLVI